MSNDGADWERLAQRVIARRAALDMTQIELAQAGGLSLDRVSAIEGKRVHTLRPRTIRSLEVGLQWEAGSLQAVLAGGEPTPVSEQRPRHLQPLDGGNEPPPPDEFGLGDEPPFPGVTHNSSGLNTPEILNDVWRLAKQAEARYYQEHGTQRDRKRRAILQYKLAAETLAEELGDAG
jgi:hypothetical protein